ncbi:MAG TPA: nucleotidyltransferase family protein [bacterium]|nr:nucleotidyltransferase family protein [bacterium]
MGKVDVLILAGGDLSDELKKYSSGYDNRSFLKIGDRYMIEYVVDAIRGVPEVGRILVVGMKQPLEELLGDRVDEVLESKPGMLDNLSMGIEKFKDNDRLMISTCDIPLITTEIIVRFLDACKTQEADLYYPIVEKKFNDKKFPTTKRTYFRLKEGVFTGGNIFILNPAVLASNWGYVDRAIAARKSPLRMLGIIGLGFILKFVFRQLSLRDIEEKVEKIFGVKGGPVLVEDPEIGVDVDKESDYLLVRDVLEERQ